MLIEGDPLTYKEVIKSKTWRDAIMSEIESIEKSKTWELTVLLEGVKLIGVKWVLKTKLNENGEVNKYKARLVTEGYAQQYKVNYTEVFALVTRLDTIILGLGAQNIWDVFQLDVKSAFFHGELSKEIFVQQPLRYEEKGEEYKSLQAKNGIVCLKASTKGMV